MSECPPEEGGEGPSVFARIVAAVREADGVLGSKTPAAGQVTLSTRKVPFVKPYKRGIMFKISACGRLHICGHDVPLSKKKNQKKRKKERKKGKKILLCTCSCVSKCVETTNGHVIFSLYFESRSLP